MILIKSIDRDISTDHVIKWLIHYKATFLRLNNTTEIKSIRFIEDNFIIDLENGDSICTGDVDAYWYRRGNYTDNWENTLTGIEEFDEIYTDYISGENKSLGDFLINHLKEYTKCIGDSESCLDVNKHIILRYAKNLGIKTPEFIITDNKRDVITFHNTYKDIITKPLHTAFIYGTDDYWLPTYTESITDDILTQFPEKFKPTLFQRNIPKKYEIRSFYLDGEFYSMAIFSQNDEQTKVDFRIYNEHVPNRNVPFRLPEEQEKKLKQLMEKAGFESGSIDLIYSTDQQFYFLEVNPIGHFGMVSYPCNYQLEKKIAQSLIS